MKKQLKVAMIRRSRSIFGAYVHQQSAEGEVFGRDLLRGRGTQDIDESWKRVVLGSELLYPHYELLQIRREDQDLKPGDDKRMTRLGRYQNEARRDNAASQSSDEIDGPA